jgi:chemotaxis methyl-accepting protein methylase
LPACLRVVRANSTAHARAILERHHALIGPAISAVLIGVTSFFRDSRVFADLDSIVLSKFADRASARIWSIGCSDGMEMYSVAMLLAERRVLHRVFLLGTDCRVTATRAAAAGRFDRQALGDVPANLLARYFCPTRADADVYEMNAFIRAQVQWRTADVVSTAEPGPWDVILCRNMAMYMRADAVSELWNRLARALRPGGYLVLGKAERPHGQSCLVPVAPCIYRRQR